MPSHRNRRAAMIKLGRPIPKQKREQQSVTRRSENIHNSSKSCSKESFASLNSKSISKKLHLTNKSGSSIEGNFRSPKSIINSDDSDSESESDEDSGFDDAFDCKSEVNCNKSKSNTSKPKDISGLTESLSHVHVSIPKNKNSPKTIETKKLLLKRKSLTGLILKQRRRLLRNSVIHCQASIK